MRKTVLTTKLELLCAGNRSKKYLIFEKWEHFENGQNWPQRKGYSHWKGVSLAQKVKMPKRCENHSTTTLQLLCARSRSKKHLIFEKWENFENGQNWPWWKGYSLCKIVNLAQKLKIQKKWEKRLYDHIRVVVCKKPLQKTPNIRKMRAFWKWPKLATTKSL